MSVYGVTFYLPTKVADLLGRKTGFVVGVVSAVPWICALAAAFFLPRWAARLGAPRAVAAGALVLAGVAIAVSATTSTGLALGALCVATAGFIGAQPIFWTFPTDILTGVGAAGGIALINSMGAVGGFIAPNLKTWSEGVMESAMAGQIALGAASVIAGVLILALRMRKRV